jgi:hypothetical protein
MRDNNFLDYGTEKSQEKISLLPKDKKDKDIYADYQDSTLGLENSDNINVIAFKQSTNPTKSKYDNVVGWVNLENNG